MTDTDNIKIPTHLEPLVAQIREFDESPEHADHDSMLLDHELTKKERYIIHTFIESLNLYSESIALAGSNNKKIRVLRCGGSDDTSSDRPTDRPTDRDRPIENEDVDCFSSNVGAPYPCTDPDMVEYYNEAFDQMFNTKEKWNLFLSERRDDGMKIRKEITDVRERICRAIRADPSYAAYQKLRLRGQGNRIRGDVYHHGSDGKHFVSIDIKSANFTCMKLICPTLFANENGEPMSWHDYVRTLTDSEFIAQSKIFREIVFGKLGFAKGANVLQEAIMERVDQVLRAEIPKTFNDDSIRMKCGDENVYELDTNYIEEENAVYSSGVDYLLEHITSGALQSTLHQIRVSDIPTLSTLFETLGYETDVELGDIFHIRIFKVEKIGAKKYFVKTFSYRSDWTEDDYRIIKEQVQLRHTDDYLATSTRILLRAPLPLRKRIEFKRVDKRFYLQVLKYYQELPIEPNDLYFTDSGVKAQYCYSIFD